MSIQVNFASIAPAVKQKVMPALKEQYEMEATLWKTLLNEGKGDFIDGKGFRIPSRFRPSTGLTYGTEGFSFNQPGAAVHDDMYVYPTQVAMAYDLTGRAIRTVEKGGEDVLIKGLTGLLSEKTTALAKEMEIGVFGDGSALRSIYKSGTTTVTLYNSTAHTPLATYGSTNGAVHMRVGEIYDLYDATLATLRGTAQVTAKTNTTITIPAAIAGATDTDIFVPSNGVNKAPRGLAYIVNNDTGLFQLLSRSTYTELKCPVEDLNGSAISVATFTKIKNQLLARAGAGMAKKVTAIYGVAQKDALERLGINFKRFDGGATKYDGSFQEFGHGDTSFIFANDCDQDRVYLTVPGSLLKFEEMPFGDYDLDGNQLRMKSGTGGYGSDAYTGALGWSGNCGTDEPRFFALIKRAAVSGLASLVSANA